MIAALYARYSSDQQREESIVAQLRACREYCKRKGYNVIHEYADEAYSGTNDNRPQFQEMLAAADADHDRQGGNDQRKGRGKDRACYAARSYGFSFCRFG